MHLGRGHARIHRVQHCPRTETTIRDVSPVYSRIRELSTVGKAGYAWPVPQTEPDTLVQYRR
eukprot:3008218-Rhodomonas_salina.1